MVVAVLVQEAEGSETDGDGVLVGGDGDGEGVGEKEWGERERLRERVVVRDSVGVGVATRLMDGVRVSVAVGGDRVGVLLPERDSVVQVRVSVGGLWLQETVAVAVGDTVRPRDCDGVVDKVAVGVADMRSEGLSDAVTEYEGVALGTSLAEAVKVHVRVMEGTWLQLPVADRVFVGLWGAVKDGALRLSDAVLRLTEPRVRLGLRLRVWLALVVALDVGLPVAVSDALKLLVRDRLALPEPLPEPLALVVPDAVAETVERVNEADAEPEALRVRDPDGVRALVRVALRVKVGGEAVGETVLLTEPERLSVAELLRVWVDAERLMSDGERLRVREPADAERTREGVAEADRDGLWDRVTEGVAVWRGVGLHDCDAEGVAPLRLWVVKVVVGLLDGVGLRHALLLRVRERRL